MGNLVDVGKILKMLGKKYLFKGCKVTHVTQVLTHYWGRHCQCYWERMEKRELWGCQSCCITSIC